MERIVIAGLWKSQISPFGEQSRNTLVSATSDPAGAVQRAAVPVRQAGRGDLRPEASEAAVHGGLRDHPLRRAPPLPLPEALPGVRPAATGQGHGAAGHHGVVLQAPHGGQPVRLASHLQHLQGQLRLEASHATRLRATKLLVFLYTDGNFVFSSTTRHGKAVIVSIAQPLHRDFKLKDKPDVCGSCCRILLWTAELFWNAKHRLLD